MCTLGNCIVHLQCAINWISSDIVVTIPSQAIDSANFLRQFTDYMYVAIAETKSYTLGFISGKHNNILHHPEHLSLFVSDVSTNGHLIYIMYNISSKCEPILAKLVLCFVNLQCWSLRT